MAAAPFGVNADTLTAIHTGISALVFAMIRQLPPDKQKAFADDLATFARARERAGDSTGETFLLDLYRAAQTAM
jgi:hypothetical protein